MTTNDRGEGVVCRPGTPMVRCNQRDIILDKMYASNSERRRPYSTHRRPNLSGFACASLAHTRLLRILRRIERDGFTDCRCIICETRVGALIEKPDRKFRPKLISPRASSFSRPAFRAKLVNFNFTPSNYYKVYSADTKKEKKNIIIKINE